MQWLRDLTNTERLLRIEFEHLSAIRRGNDLVSHDAWRMAARRITRCVGEIRSTIDMHVGQDPGERNAVAGQVDHVLPVYSRLCKLMSRPS